MAGQLESSQPEAGPPLSISLPTPEATQALGEWIGEQLFPGSVLALVGPLGAGKTHLVRAIAHGLGIRDDYRVTSPTFVLLQEYSARLPIYHFDAYRLAGAQAFQDLGVQEYLEGEGVSLIEWADRVPSCLPTHHLRIVLTVTGPTSRQAMLEPFGARYQQLLSRWQGNEVIDSEQPH